jgi:hypothetical protein
VGTSKAGWRMLIFCCSSKPASLLPAYTTSKSILKKYCYINYSVWLLQNYCTFFPVYLQYTTTFSTFDTNKNLTFKFSPFIAAGFPPPYFQEKRKFQKSSILPKIPMSYLSKPNSCPGQIKLKRLRLRTKDYTLLEMIQPRRFTILRLSIVQKLEPKQLEVKSQVNTMKLWQ